jgi:hypothetical protein
MTVEIQDSKFVTLMQGIATAATSATVTAAIDCLGWNYGRFIFMAPAGTATGVACKSLVISEGTSTASYAAVAGLRGGTATGSTVDFVVGSLSTSEPVAICLDVALQARARYLKASLTVGEKYIPVMAALLTRGSVEPGSDAGSMVQHIKA